MLWPLREISERLEKFDIWLLVFPAALIAIGFSTLQSINLAGGEGAPNIIDRQVLALILGLALMALLSSWDYRYFYFFSFLFYLLSLTLLVLVLVSGDAVRGAVRWFEIAGYQFQPSEIVKPLLIVFFASFLEWSRRFLTDFQTMFVSLGLLLPIEILVFLEPDLSTMIILFMIWLGIIWFGLADLRPLLVVCIITLLILPSGYLALNPYQRSRVSSFLDPYKDPLGTGYNAIQATIAVGSGQVWGRQWGKGTQSHLSFLPDKHTDFIFATFCEEQGFIGAMVLLTIYSLFFLRLLRILSFVNDYVGRIIVGGVLFMFWVQFTVNVGMNIGLLPVTGVPLPFVSYGGTSLIVSLVSLGLVESVVRQRT